MKIKQKYDYGCSPCISGTFDEHEESLIKQIAEVHLDFSHFDHIKSTEIWVKLHKTTMNLAELTPLDWGYKTLLFFCIKEWSSLKTESSKGKSFDQIMFPSHIYISIKNLNLRRNLQVTDCSSNQKRGYEND